MRAIAFMVVLLAVLLSTAVMAEVPALINYQGSLTDAGGVALDTTVSMTFTIYDDSTAGSTKWTETQPSVQVSAGIFNVLLGRVNSIPDTVFNDPVRWLGIQVGGDPELTPRQRIAAMGYAFRAAQADTAEYAKMSLSDGDWTISGIDMYSAVPGNVGIGTTSPATDLDVYRSSATAWMRAKSDVGYAGFIIDRAANAQNGYIIYRTGGHDSWYLGQIGAGSANNNFAISTSYNPADGKFYLTQAGHLGIGTSSPAANLHIASQGNTELRIDHDDIQSTLSFYRGATSKGYLVKDDDYQRLTISADGSNDHVTILESNGSVGIGTSSPAVALDVDGDINANSLYRIGGITALSTEGNQNVFVGKHAGVINTGHHNTFVGDSAGVANTSSYHNTFVGAEAGKFNTTGNLNMFSGYQAGYGNTTGSSNTFLGGWAGQSSTEGARNTFVGAGAGNQNTTGTQNTYLGAWAGRYNQTGTGNVFIGYEAGRSEPYSNKLYIANGPDSSDVVIYGDFSSGNVGVGTLNPSEKLHVAGNAVVDDTLFASNVSSNSPLQLQTAGMSRVFIDDTTGNVGIGTTNPNSLLTLSGVPMISVGTSDGSDNSYLAITGGGEAANWRGASIKLNGNEHTHGGRLSITAGYDNATTTGPDEGIIVFLTGTGASGTERIRIDRDGYVGIGTDSPTSRMDVNGAKGYDQLRMRTSYTPTGTADANGNVGDITWDDSYVYIKTSAGWKRASLTIF